MKKFIGHFKTITKHRHAVIRHCAKCGILWQGLLHDLSKYSAVEFWPGVKYWTGTKSPTEGERKEQGYSAAWLHHQGRNKHHFEYWIDYNPVTHRHEPVPMPARYVAEMFCDRVAASKIYKGINYDQTYPLEYFLRGKPGRIIHPRTSNELEYFLTLLAEQGEEVAFAAVKNFVKKAKK